jgi:hypothetical protein
MLRWSQHKPKQHAKSGNDRRRMRHDLKVIQPHIHARRIVLLVLSLVIVLGVGLAARSLAQAADGPWTIPANVSKSGAAFQPVIAAAPNGVLHVLWWDPLEGEQYARTTGVTSTTWTKSVGVEPIVGKREVNKETNKVTLTAPRGVRLLADARGTVHGFWYDIDNQLFEAQTQGAGWSTETALAEAALNMDAVADANGTLHLAYVRPLNATGAPAGVYYRATIGAGWSAPVLVYTSSYFRTAKPDEANVSVAGDGQGRVIVAWDDPRLGRSLYARSTDGGRTWSDPQPVVGDQADPASQAHVAFANGGFLLLWQEASAGGGCDLSQRRSTDAGQTWSTPERALTNLNQCSGRWEFATGGDGRLWLLGMPAASNPSAGNVAGMLAAWDGKIWAAPVDVSLSFQDTATGRPISLGCLGMTLAGRSVGVVGCDAGGDVWAARNATGLENLIPALKPAWSVIETLSDRSGPAAVEGVAALATDRQGKLYAMWSQSVAEGEPGTLLYVAVWDGTRWSRGVPVLAPKDPAGASGGERVAQPALAADAQGRLHAVWSGGAGGQILYSWKYARDAGTSLGWATPVALPSQAGLGSWPDVVADPRGDALHVIYAVPYNEGRGIYYVRSDDGGSTWKKPVLVFDAVAAKWESADKPRLVLDANANVLHAVWLRASLLSGIGTQAVYYARSSDGGQTWSAPVKVAEGAVDWPRVAVGSANQVYLVWNQARARSASTDVSPSAEVWSQFSTDGGKRWSEAARVRGFDQVSGPVGLTSDGAGGLYLAGIGQRTGGESALLYARWDGRAWGENETFGLGQNAAPGNAASAALVPGAGRLGVVVRELMRLPDSAPQSGGLQGGSAQFEVVATGQDVKVATAATPAPTFTPMPAQTPEPTATPSPTPTARPQVSSTYLSRSANRSQLPLMLGIALAAVIVMGVVVGRVVWTGRR